MKTTNSLVERLVALALSMIMLLGMLPAGAFAVSSSVIATTLGDERYTVGQTADFTVTTTGNDDAGTMVLGSFEIQQNGSPVNVADVAKLEYQEYPGGTWYEFYGDFGPAATGFPLQAEATASNFRVTFQVSGEYTVKVFVKTFDDSTELCAVEKTISVSKANPATMTTTLAEQSYKVGQTSNFTVTTTGNDDADTMVLGSFEIQQNGSPVNIADVAKLEYQEYPSGTWYEFYGDFGPAATGFPLQAEATTSNFRVTFQTGGEYTVSVFVKTIANGDVLCAIEKTIAVKSDQVDFEFAEKTPIISFNDNAQNKYKYEVQNAKGTVTYSIVSGSELAVIDPDSGELTVSKPGTIVVKAADTGNSLHNPAEATYTLTVKKDEQRIAFAAPVPENQWVGETYTNKASGGNGTGVISYWLLNDGELVGEIANVAKIDTVNGELTFLCVGTQVTVKAIKAADDFYAEASATYSVTAIKKEPVDFGFTTSGPITIPYDAENLTYNNQVVGKSDRDTVTWSVVSGADVADLNTVTGVLTIKKAGTIVIRATIEESPNCLEKSVDYTLTIQHADQAALDTSKIPTEITYDPNAQEDLIIAAGGSGTGAYRYEIVEGNEFAEINAVNGTIQILKAGNFVDGSFAPGSVKIKITKSGDDCYNAAEAVYVTVDLTRADQHFIFDHDKDIQNRYGLSSFKTQITLSQLNSGKVTYTVSNNTIGAAVDKNGKVSFANSNGKVGAVTVTVTMEEDDCYNQFADSYTITLGYEPVPEAPYTLSGEKIVNDSDWFTGDVTILAPDGYAISYSNSLDATWGASVLWRTDGSANVWPDGAAPVVYLRNSTTGGITDAIPVSDLKRDSEKPSGLSISYHVSVLATIAEKIFGFNASKVTVTINASDSLSGIGKMEYSLDEGNSYIEITADNGKYAFDVSPQYRGQLWMRATDVAGNADVYKHIDNETEKILVVDDIAPKVEIAFTGDRQDAVKADTDSTISRETMTNFDATTRFIYNGNVTATLKVEEANFFPENEDMSVKITQDGSVVTDLAAAGITDSGWKLADNVYTRTFVMTADGDYQVFAEYQDHSQNDMEWESQEYAKTGTYSYESNIHTIDTTAPVYEITYNNNTLIQTLDGREYYDNGRTAAIKVTDRNFRPDEVVFAVVYTDISGVQVNYTYSGLTSWNDWTQDGITWTATVPFAADADYTVDFAYDDIANHKMVNTGNVEEAYSRQFTVDTTKPADLKVSYHSKDDQVLNKILGAITFGNYKAEQEVVLTMTDATAGIDHIKLNVTPDGPVSATDLEMPEDLVINADGTVRSGSKGFIGLIESTAVNGDLTLRFDVPAQFRGKVSFAAYDKSGNVNDSHVDAGVLVVDTIAPGHTISYNPSNVIGVSDMKNMTGFDAANEIIDITSTDPSYVMYFSGDAVATIKIDEANFDPGAVKIEVLDSKGIAIQGWTQTEWTTATEAGKAEPHTKTVTIPAEGDYQLRVYYQDHSMNTPVDYLSQWIVVDKTAPVIEVAYSNTDVKNRIGDRNYFSAAQTATITIKEHNFRADDVVIKVAAQDVLGTDVLTLNADGTVKAYADQGAERKNWTAFEAGTWRIKDDTFVMTLNYTADANYTFDIEYQDLACNKAADYEQDLFTVDVTAPEDLTVNYSTSVFEQVKESITFGYYNAMMTVTITATDDTSGIYHFAYSYIKGKNVSGVNAELLDQAIKEAEITYEGKKATATFKIPKMVLENDDQFNGTVAFAAFDRSEVSAELKDAKVIVVDNIAPTAKITYNAPVQNVNGISYYDGSIDATIVINEANFDAKDVTVSVTRNGTAFPVNVAWRDNSVDTHTGTFTLAEDGDYIVSVRYKDKSGNQMASYTSDKLTLDTTKPTIYVSNIKANSANKNETYSFTITVDDINLDVGSIKPVMKAVKQTAEGIYEVVEIELGKAATVVNGQTYTYTVENLPDDGLYTLTCEAKDMSANGISKIGLDDGAAYDQVQFSINRGGSVFGYGNAFAEKLVGQYYIYRVDEDVVIVEVNVDPIEDYRISLNGKDLIESVDYTTTQTSKDGEWSKRTYTIKKDLFGAEGEYSIIVSSTDKADTTAFSDVKNLSLAFVVDRTAPVLTITGLEAGGRYQTDAQTVTLIPTDEGGRLNSLSVVVLNSDGRPLTENSGNDISVRFEMAGEDLLKYLEENDGKVTFTIPEGLNNQVKIICNDCAVNAEGLTNEYNELFERITVSRNQLVIFYANKPLFYGTIAGVLAVIVLMVILIKHKKDKKNKAKAKI